MASELPADREQKNVNLALQLALFEECQTRPRSSAGEREGLFQRSALDKRGECAINKNGAPAKRSVRSWDHDRETGLCPW